MINKKLLIVLIGAFLIRLVGINQSLWLDEATTAKAVSQYSFAEILTKFSPADFHPPLYNIFMKLWTYTFGFSEIAIRLPSVLFSLLAGVAVFYLGGIWASTLFLFNPLIVYYSQEARMYMMAVFFLVCALYYFIRMTGSRTKSTMTKDFMLFNVFCILSFATFYGSVFLISAFYAFLLFRKRYSALIKSALMLLVSIILLSPLLIRQVMNSRQALSLIPNWNLALGKVTIKNLILIPMKFSVGRISFEPKILYYTLAAAFSLFVFYFVFKRGLKHKKYLFLLAVPIVIGTIFSLYSPLLQYFRFLYLIPLMAIILGKSDKPKYANYIIFAGFLFFSAAYLLIPGFHREDWKSLAGSLPKNIPVYMIIPSSDPLKHYRPDIKISELRNSIPTEKEIIVIPYASEIYGYDYSSLLKTDYYINRKKSFRNLQYEVWKKMF